MFPVQVRIDNRGGLLRPGMNSEVEIHVGERDDVLAVPNAALRTQRDVGSAAQVLGLSAEEVQRELAQAAPQARLGGTDGGRRDGLRSRQAEGRRPVGRRAPDQSGSGVRWTPRSAGGISYS